MQSRSTPRLLAFGAVAILAGLLAAAPATAADSHRHDTHTAVLQLDQGARWQTDAALRTGMEAIRDALARAIPQVHAGRFDAAQYRALAEGVEGQVAYIVQNCKLKPEADEVLHAIIARLGQGVEVIGGHAAGTEPEQGVVHLAQTLDDYAAHFDHPGWKGLEMGH